MSEIKSVEELIFAFGGPVHIASKFNVHQITVERWGKSGIPSKYWKLLSKLTGLSLDEIVAINDKVKKGRVNAK